MSKKNKITLKQYHKINCVDDIINITENIDEMFAYDCNWLIKSDVWENDDTFLILNYSFDTEKSNIQIEKIIKTHSILIDRKEDWLKFQSWFLLKYPQKYNRFNISIDKIETELLKTEFKEKYIIKKFEEIKDCILYDVNSPLVDFILKGAHSENAIIPSPCHSMHQLYEYFDILELYNAEKYLKSLLNNKAMEKSDISNSEFDVENLNEPIESIPIDRVNHKIILLHKIGVINFIAEKYYENNKGSNLAKLLGSLFNSDKKEIETIRKTLSYLDIKDNKNNPENKTSLKAVKKYLLDFGIDLPEFNEID